MKIFSMHRLPAAYDHVTDPPPKSVIEGMGALIGDMASKGIFVGGEGLSGSKTRFRIVNGGTVEHGPYLGRNELIAATCMFRAFGREEAERWAQRYVALVGGDAEVEVGPVHEPWEFGMMPRPQEPVPTRYLLLQKATAQTEAGDLSARARLAPLFDEMRAANVFLSAETLTPSAEGKRIKTERGHSTVFDGPFAESKELVGGFSIIRVSSMEQALELSERFVAVFAGQDVELDLRPIVEVAP